MDRAKDGVVELAEKDPDSSRKLIEYAKDLTLPKLLTVLGFLLIAWGVGLVSGNVAIL